jgi:cytoplasmic iron level regulating protein YaaA (DUF328/UPF0246 family)
MLVVLSPAKNLNFSSEVLLQNRTSAVMLESSEKIMARLKRMMPLDLESLMKISPKLADLNYERNQNWSLPMSENESKQAALAFNGEVYNGLDFPSFSEEEVKYSQDHLRILSGLYGVLRPLDEILPYRLEMGTRLEVQEGQKNLYQFWGESITNQLNRQLQRVDSRYIVNLASNEYFKSVKAKTLDVPVITPVFKERKGEEFKIVMMYAKHARGLMASYIIKNKVKNLEVLKAYNEDGYFFNEELSNSSNIVFTRE